MLTEQQVRQDWQKLFNTKQISEELIDKAEALIEELRPESPLRHRLMVELKELRKLHRVR